MCVPGRSTQIDESVLRLGYGLVELDAGSKDSLPGRIAEDLFRQS